MTQLERIKNMTLDEMMKFIRDEEGACGHCIYADDDNCQGSKCRQGITAWLNQEVESQNDNFKYDSGKPRLALVPPELIEAVGAVRTFGVQKYSDSECWKKVEVYRYNDALMRHICKYLENPKSVDDESGLPHLWHAACNIAFLIALEEKDDS